MSKLWFTYSQLWRMNPIINHNLIRCMKLIPFNLDLYFSKDSFFLGLMNPRNDEFLSLDQLYYFDLLRIRYES